MDKTFLFFQKTISKIIKYYKDYFKSKRNIYKLERKKSSQATWNKNVFTIKF